MVKLHDELSIVFSQEVGHHFILQFLSDYLQFLQMSLPWPMIVTLPFLARPQQQPLEDDLTVHLKEYFDLILLLLIREDLQRQNLEVGRIFDAEFRGEEVDFGVGEGLDQRGVYLGFEEGVLTWVADVVVGLKHEGVVVSEVLREQVLLGLLDGFAG